MIEQTAAISGFPAILVTNSGGPPPGQFMDHDDETWEAALRNNMLGHIDMARRCPPPMIEEGFYTLIDRSKDMIISGGENIYPAELERVLADFAGLAEFAIVGREDARWGQVPVVVAVRADSSLTAEDVLAHFNDRIASFKRPKDVVFVEALPRNALGKIVAGDVRALLA